MNCCVSQNFRHILAFAVCLKKFWSGPGANFGKLQNRKWGVLSYDTGDIAPGCLIPNMAFFWFVNASAFFRHCYFSHNTKLFQFFFIKHSHNNFPHLCDAFPGPSEHCWQRRPCGRLHATRFGMKLRGSWCLLDLAQAKVPTQGCKLILGFHCFNALCALIDTNQLRGVEAYNAWLTRKHSMTPWNEERPSIWPWCACRKRHSARTSEGSGGGGAE